MIERQSKILADLCAKGDHLPDQDGICSTCGCDVISTQADRIAELESALRLARKHVPHFAAVEIDRVLEGSE